LIFQSLLGFARGISELHLGKLVGTRTWGGGIWLSSDNKLVDGGLVTAPEVGTYNENFGWGLGIEQAGVIPDYIVDNNPRETFDGRDEQLEKAINVLRTWLLEEPIAFPRSPNQHPDMTLNKEVEGCVA
jgi:tricorn protease